MMIWRLALVISGRAVAEGMVHVVRLEPLHAQVGGVPVEVLIDKNLHPADGGECVDCLLGLEGLAAGARETKC